MQNEPGVLSRVSGILAARGFNIDSLVVCATEIEDLSRMCIVLRGQDGVIEQARRQLEDLVSPGLSRVGRRFIGRTDKEAGIKARPFCDASRSLRID